MQSSPSEMFAGVLAKPLFTIVFFSIKTKAGFLINKQHLENFGKNTLKGKGVNF